MTADDGPPPGYPVDLVLAGRPCLVVGGGRVAVGKVAGLVAVGARVTVVAPEVDPGIERFDVAIERRPYRPGEAAAYRFVVTATGDAAVDGAVAADADSAGVLVNAADDPARCTATLPAVLRRGRLQVAVSTGGTSPAVAGWVRDRIAEVVGEEMGVLLAIVGEERAALRAEGRRTTGLDWKAAFDAAMLELIRAGRVDEAKERLRACLSSSSD